MSASVTFFFIAQPGNLNFKSRLLALSLRRFAPPGTRIAACVPNGLPELDSNTRRAFDMFEVDLMGFEPELWRRYNYPIGNKVDASCLDFGTEKAVFLDSDIFVVKPFESASLLEGSLSARSIMAVQCFRPEFANAMRELVARTTGIDNLVVDPALARNPTVRSIGVPMFNSGVVQFSTGEGIAQRWKELLAAVMNADEIPDRFKFPFADQTSLALLALELGDRFRLARKVWNTNINNQQRLKDAIFVHYFRLYSLFSNPDCAPLVKEIVQSVPSSDFSLLGEL